MRWFPGPTAGRRLVSTARPILRATGVVAALAWTLSGEAASASPREREPRLMLAGGHAVRAGQLIDLRWSPADSVSELEILLSLDGGRNYSVCISPQLDPRRCDFLWRVPHVGRAALRMRIRFNRGGREIEGAPTPLLWAGDDGRPEPLALPPASGSPAERAPQSSGERGAPSGRPAAGSSDVSAQVAAPDRSDHDRHGTPCTAKLLPSGAALQSTPSVSRSFPLRT